MPQTQTTNELVAYYQNLLILQYVGMPKAAATIGTTVAPNLMPQTTVQVLTFSSAPTSGSFALRYAPPFTTPVVTSISWNTATADIQAALRGISGLEEVVVTGSIASGTLTILFTGVNAPATLLTVSSNTLVTSSVPVVIASTETDEILPLAVQDGFNFIAGTGIAQGKQLDVLGKYAGVSRTGPGFSSTITLDDADFYSYILIATVLNSMGSSLADIQNFIAQFFATQMLVFDYANMHMSYLISSAIGSQSLIQLLVTQGRLPKPMGVQLAVTIYAPVINKFFGFRTYQSAAFNTSPFNSYASYQTDWPWLSYANAITTS